MVQAYTRRRKPEPDAEQADSAKGRGRRSLEAKAARAETVLHNPDIRAAFDSARAEIIRDIEHVDMDGSEATANRVLERVRELHALNRLQRVILRPLATLLQQEKQNRDN